MFIKKIKKYLILLYYIFLTFLSVYLIFSFVASFINLNIMYFDLSNWHKAVRGMYIFFCLFISFIIIKESY